MKRLLRGSLSSTIKWIGGHFNNCVEMEKLQQVAFANEAFLCKRNVEDSL